VFVETACCCNLYCAAQPCTGCVALRPLAVQIRQRAQSSDGRQPAWDIAKAVGREIDPNRTDRPMHILQKAIGRLVEGKAEI